LIETKWRRYLSIDQCIVFGLRAVADIAQAFNEALGRDTVMADDPNAAPSQAAETPPRTAPDRAVHARAVKAEKHAHRKCL